MILLCRTIIWFALSSNFPASAEMLFSACEIGDPATKLTVRADCAQFLTFENPEDNSSPPLSIFIARLSARSSDIRNDPLTILAGGPGQSASETYPAIQMAFESIRKHRDIYLIDQRGTGQSNKLTCPENNEQNNSLSFDLVKIKESSLACLTSLAVDSKFYTTSIAVRDLEAIRQELNIEQWNIYGVSYGTRVGLHYLRQYSDSVRTMILDAVVPPDVSLGMTIATGAQRSLDLMLDRCEDTASCNRNFPRLAQNTKELLRSLKKDPKNISFENFSSGKLEELVFTAEHLTSTLRLLSYSGHGISILPVLLNDAYENGNFAPLARQALRQVDTLGSTIASGMHSAVICTEDEPYIALTDDLKAEMLNTYLGLVPVEALQATCNIWPSGIIDSNFKDPVISDKPILILSGEADPITPPEFGDSMVKTLSKSLHIVNPGQGHMQAILGCTPRIMNNFIERASPDDVDFGCLERQRPIPFFIDANGPMP